MTLSHRVERGVVLPLVLIIALLLSAAILTFVQRSIVDGMIVRNRDKAAAAEALARGGAQIAFAIAVHDRYAKLMAQLGGSGQAGATLEDVWARAALSPLESNPRSRPRSARAIITDNCPANKTPAANESRSEKRFSMRNRDGRILIANATPISVSACLRT